MNCVLLTSAPQEVAHRTLASLTSRGLSVQVATSAEEARMLMRVDAMVQVLLFDWRLQPAFASKFLESLVATRESLTSQLITIVVCAASQASTLIWRRALELGADLVANTFEEVDSQIRELNLRVVAA